MASKSNTQGRAYEYSCLVSLFDIISEIRPVYIVENGCLDVCRDAWDSLPDADKSIYRISANAAVNQILELEPRIVENDNDKIELQLQPDQAGEEGDVRDILIIRNAINWEIGLSLKHNNFAVKHSRLSNTIDFGNIWFGVPCSDSYWDEVRPLFESLSLEKSRGSLFRDLKDKETKYYIPLLNAFMRELENQLRNNPQVPGKLVEYLLGKFDFYKIISIDAQKYTCIQAVNLHDTLSLPSKKKKSPYEITQVKLPTRFIYMGFVPDSKTTLELYLDGGWQFTFRIHNASSKVEPSLKFDIKIIGMPTSVITINCRWKR